MRPISKTISLIFLAVLVSTSLFFAPFSHAASPIVIFEGLPADLQPKTANDYLNEFCEKRKGDLMNLETWYSGKCGDKVDTLSGDGVGFSDIVLLQGMEYLNGSQTEDFILGIVRKLNIINEIKEGIEKGAIKPSEINLAEVTNNSGIIPALGSFTSKLATTKPASSLDYMAYVSSNLKDHHIVNEAFAASPGYGFTALSPILPLWRAFRNISYLLFALGFVLYGVMIMFRIKIDAKTAASIQLAIPKLIVTLLIITFSYAIVGFLIDISAVISAMVITVLQAGDILTPDALHRIPNVVAGNSSLGAIGSFIINAFTAVMVSPFIFFNLIIGGIVGIAASFATIMLTSLNLGIIVGIIITLAVGISYAKLIFKLFQAYFSIIISLIFSPIILLGNLIPGSNSISTWLMTIIGNLAVFPVASFFLVLSYALMCQPILSILPGIIAKLPAGSIATGLITSFQTDFLENLLGVRSLSSFNSIWTPPMTVPTPDLGGWTGNSNGSLVLAAIGFGLLMMASKYCEMVEKALKTPPFPYGAAIGEALKGGYQYAPLARSKISDSGAYQAAGTLFGLKTTPSPWGTGSDKKTAEKRTPGPTPTTPT